MGSNHDRHVDAEIIRNRRERLEGLLSQDDRFSVFGKRVAEIMQRSLKRPRTETIIETESFCCAVLTAARDLGISLESK